MDSGFDITVVNSKCLMKEDMVRTGRFVQLKPAFGVCVRGELVNVTAVLCSEGNVGPVIELLIAVTYLINHVYCVCRILKIRR